MLSNELPPKVEEIIVDAYAVDAEQIGPHVGERFLNGRLRNSKSDVQLGRFTSGAGSALRSILPLGVRGSSFTATKAEGTM